MIHTTVSDLERAIGRTIAKATPHRVPDLEHVNRDAPVILQLVFAEEYNTGYDGVLFRYIGSAVTRDGVAMRSFQVDLLPELYAEQQMGEDSERAT